MQGLGKFHTVATELPFDPYGAIVLAAVPGPRREVRLTLQLWRADQTVWVRFGSIANYAEVSRFFQDWDRQPSRHYGLHRLQRGPDGYLLQWDSTEDQLLIASDRMSHGPATP